MDIEKRLPVGQAVQLLRVAHVADVMCEEAPVVKKGTHGVVESWTGRDYNRLCTVRITDGEHAGKVVRVGNRIKDDEPHKAHQVGTFFKPIGPSPDSSKGLDSGSSRTLMPATIPAKGSWWRTTPDSSTIGRSRDRSRSPRTLPKLRDGTMASKAGHATPKGATKRPAAKAGKCSAKKTRRPSAPSALTGVKKKQIEALGLKKLLVCKSWEKFSDKLGKDFQIVQFQSKSGEEYMGYRICDEATYEDTVFQADSETPLIENNEGTECEWVPSAGDSSPRISASMMTELGTAFEAALSNPLVSEFGFSKKL